MGKELAEGQLVFFDGMLVGYVKKVEPQEDGSNDVTMCVPSQVPEPEKVVTITGQEITVSLSPPQKLPQKLEAQVIVPKRDLLGADGKPAC